MAAGSRACVLTRLFPPYGLLDSHIRNVLVFILLCTSSPVWRMGASVSYLMSLHSWCFLPSWHEKLVQLTSSLLSL